MGKYRIIQVKGHSSPLLWGYNNKQYQNINDIKSAYFYKTTAPIEIKLGIKQLCLNGSQKFYALFQGEIE